MATIQGRRDLVVIGASAGGVQAIRGLLGQLSPGFSGTIAVVLHRSAYARNHLAHVLQGGTDHIVVEPQHDEPMAPGRVYLAPRDRHLLVARGRLRLDRGAKEHFTRPAADPLFRSAADSYGPQVLGIVLTGGGHDGTNGLIAVKAAGGATMAQEPSEAQAAVMPAYAIRHAEVDAVLKLHDIAGAIRSAMLADRVAAS